MAQKPFITKEQFLSFAAKADTRLDNLEAVPGIPVVTTAGTGAAYTAQVDGITALTKGLALILIPHTVSTSTGATLNLNGLGAKKIYREYSSDTSSASTSGLANGWLTSGRPVFVIYSGAEWIVVGHNRLKAADIYGQVSIANGGTGASTAGSALAKLGGLPLAGGTMTGALTLSGAPTADLHAATKKYVDECVDTLEAGKTTKQALAIPVSGWAANSSDTNFPYKCTVTITGITADHRADVSLDSGSSVAANRCGLCATTETAANSVIFKSRAKPTTALTGTLYLTKV